MPNTHRSSLGQISSGIPRPRGEACATLDGEVDRVEEKGRGEEEKESGRLVTEVLALRSTNISRTCIGTSACDPSEPFVSAWPLFQERNLLVSMHWFWCLHVRIVRIALTALCSFYITSRCLLSSYTSIEFTCKSCAVQLSNAFHSLLSSPDLGRMCMNLPTSTPSPKARPAAESQRPPGVGPAIPKYCLFRQRQEFLFCMLVNLLHPKWSR
ncbi:hypothetical protein V8C26DRAFT_56944 [Trichoderma gracile]